MTLGVACCVAQHWELGGEAGYGISRKVDVTRGSTTGQTGFENGGLASAFGTYHGKYLSGDLRYLFRKGDAVAESGSQKVNFDAESHTVHYDLLFHPKRDGERKILPYGAAGGGVRVYRGTGVEQPFSPLSNLVLPTKTNETLPVLTLGGGVSIRVSRYIVVRADFRDYITPFPSKVLQPAPGASIRGWLHDFVPMGGIAATF
jgi:hypothetical protein